MSGKQRSAAIKQRKTSGRAVKKSIGIFGKVFLYTMVLLIVSCGSLFAFFSNQIKASVRLTQQRKATQDFAPLLAQLNQSPQEIIAFSKEFHARNHGVNFRFEAADRTVLYQTPGFQMSENFSGGGKWGGAAGSAHSFPFPGTPFHVRPFKDERVRFAVENGGERTLFLASAESGVKLFISDLFTGASVYGAILAQAVWGLGLLLLVGLLSALLFAGRIDRPIQRVSAATHRMSLLEPVDAPAPRGDEIGQLSKDVYGMYGKLKDTISQLETEIAHVKKMEEHQRYFFSAASHELKTPIAALGAILEGMAEQVVAPKEYPKYFQECMQLLSEQNKLVSEILEIVKLSGEFTLEMEEISLAPSVAAVLEPLGPLMESKGQRVALDLPAGLRCRANPGLLARALSNVALNAAQNSPEGAEIKIAATQQGDSIRLTVWNAGAQIPEDTLPKLFEPFYRADQARTGGAGHSGLGLTIVKKALDLMKIPCGMSNADGGILFELQLHK
jgi:two-component system sensor histidine kinase VanS